MNKNSLFTYFANQSIKQVLDELNANEQGLTQQQIAARQKRYGLNEIKEKKITWLLILKRQLTSSFIYVFFAIAAFYFILKEYHEGFIILAIVLLNLSIGFYQEYKASTALRLLKQYLINKIKTKRNGIETEVPSSQLVPGDIIILKPGDSIPADCKIITAENLSLDESALTGESKPVHKTNRESTNKNLTVFNVESICFAGTTVSTGNGIAVIYATGNNTKLGSIAYLTTQAMRESNLVQGTTQLAQFILKLIFVTLSVSLTINIFLSTSDISVINLFMFCAALAISVIPEALPVVITFCLSRGVSELAKNKVIVKRLSALEDLGGIDILCTDKTGTLTENTLVVDSVFENEKAKTILYAVLGSEISTKKNVHGFDAALLSYLENKKEVPHYQKITEVAFDTIRGKNTVITKSAHEYLLISRGIYEKILAKCTHTSADLKHNIEKWITAEEKKGNRVLTIAYKQINPKDEKTIHIEEEENNLTLLGAISFTDPLKKTAITAIKKSQALGLKIKVLSGDSKYVCGTIAQQVGLIKSEDMVLTGDEFNKKSAEERSAAVIHYNVFARVTPEQKFEIIQLLQDTYSVGYLGDGINDAPSLRLANVSLAVQDAANIARDASDIILLKKSLLYIVNGIEEGRKVLINTLKYIKITIASNFGNFYSLSIASFLINYLPMLPFQLLILNLISDFPMIAISTDNVSKQEMSKPKKYNLRDIIFIATILGIVSSFFDFIIFALFKNGPEKILQTSWFVFSVLTEIVLIFSLRTTGLFFKAKKPSWELIMLSIIACAMTIILPLTTFGQYNLSFSPQINFALIMLIVTAYFIASELVKLFYYWIERKNTAQ